jgi:pSer/pThr/pTyr-binding forkhead associated (FHA) protein
MTVPRAWLVDEHWGKAYRLKETTSIGRGPDNAVILREPEVSRLHADVHFDGSDFLLRRLGAAGTRLNDVPLDQPRALHEGDRVEIGFTTLRFTQRDPAEIDALEISRDLPTPRESIEVPTSASMRASTAQPPHRARARAVRLWWMIAAVALVLIGLAIALVLR